MAQKNNGVSINFAGLLTIAFIVLKLTNFINWSWWLILLPITFPVWIAFIIFIFSLFIALIVWLYSLKKTKK